MFNRRIYNRCRSYRVDLFTACFFDRRAKLTHYNYVRIWRMCLKNCMTVYVVASDGSGRMAELSLGVGLFTAFLCLLVHLWGIDWWKFHSLAAIRPGTISYIFHCCKKLRHVVIRSLRNYALIVQLCITHFAITFVYNYCTCINVPGVFTSLQ